MAHQEIGSLKRLNVLHETRISPNSPIGSSSRFYLLSFHFSHLLLRQNSASIPISIDFVASCLWTRLNLICSCFTLIQLSSNWLIHFSFSLVFHHSNQSFNIFTVISSTLVFSAQEELQVSASLSPGPLRPQHPPNSSSFWRSGLTGNLAACVMSQTQIPSDVCRLLLVYVWGHSSARLISPHPKTTMLSW